MTERRHLSGRRANEGSDYTHSGFRFSLTLGCFPEGTPAEIFINCNKGGSPIEAIAMDGAVLISLLLQHNVAIKDIAHSIMRNSDGSAATPIGAALDHVIGIMERGR